MQKRHTDKTTLNRADTITKRNQLFRDYYTIGKQIESSNGKDGEIRLCRNLTTGEVKRVIIVKKEFLKEPQRSLFKQELEKLKSLKHENLIRLSEVYEDRRFYHMVIEQISGEPIFSCVAQMNSFSEKDAALIIQQLLLAVNRCHQNGLIFGNLNPFSFYYDSEQDEYERVKIVDIPTSLCYDDKQKQLSHPQYICFTAPELLMDMDPEVETLSQDENAIKTTENEDKPQKKLDCRCDIWSIGVLLYILFSGSIPFKGNNEFEIMNNMRTRSISFSEPIWEDVSDNAKKLILRMLAEDYKKRPHVNDVLSDAWMRNLSKKQFDNKLQMQVFAKLASMDFISQTKIEKVEAENENKLSQDEERRLKKISQQIQRVDQGLIDRYELLQGMTKLHGQSKAMEEIAKMLEIADTDVSSTVNLSEFKIGYTQRNAHSR